MLTFEEKRKLDETKRKIRNLQRRVNNAQHTLNANLQELENMQRERFDEDIVKRQEECCDYWQTEVEKLEGKVFLICLETGLNEETAWQH